MSQPLWYHRDEIKEVRGTWFAFGLLAGIATTVAFYHFVAAYLIEYLI